MYADGSYAERNPTYHVEDSPWKARQVLQVLDKLAFHPKSVCEVGCGAGEILRQLQQAMPHDVQFSGFEISPAAASLAKSRENSRLRIFEADLLKEPVREYDVLLVMDVIEHVEDYFSFLRGLRGRAKMIILHVPLEMCVQLVLRMKPLLVGREVVGHIHYFSKDTCLAALQDCGFQIRAWNYTKGSIERGTSLRTRLASIPRRLMFRVNQDLAVRVLGGYSLLAVVEPA
jgi:cyclopropane fatty-acyl-phospholipid synthase-like methyltransferase